MDCGLDSYTSVLSRPDGSSKTCRHPAGSTDTEVCPRSHEPQVFESACNFRRLCPFLTPLRTVIPKDGCAASLLESGKDIQEWLLQKPAAQYDQAPSGVRVRAAKDVIYMERSYLQNIRIILRGFKSIVTAQLDHKNTRHHHPTRNDTLMPKWSLRKCLVSFDAGRLAIRPNSMASIKRVVVDVMIREERDSRRDRTGVGNVSFCDRSIR